MSATCSTSTGVGTKCIPGVLQTPEYIDAVCAAVFPERSERERGRFVDFRVARQELLRREPERPEVSFILSEVAILRPVGGAGVMRRQLEECVGHPLFSRDDDY